MFSRLLIAAALCVAFAAPAAAQETMIVYFAKGFYPAEDKALDEVIDKFQKKTGVKVELSRYAPQEMIPKTVAALDSGTPPQPIGTWLSIAWWRTRLSGAERAPQ